MTATHMAPDQLTSPGPGKDAYIPIYPLPHTL